ncbi:MAG: flagellar hook-associated protein FlgK [Thermodesulfobacteriota bacterium]
MGLTSTFFIAQRGLAIAQAALEVVSHNVANVNTEGYSRQRINLETPLPWTSRLGPLGTGVDAQNITRMHDRFIVANLIEKSSILAKYEAQKISIDALESFFNETNGNGINEGLSDFWNAWQEVANNPEGNPERMSLLEKATTLANQINRTRQDLDYLRAEINQRVEEAVGFVNTLVEEIAAINEKIVAMEAGYMQQANDLRDQREQHLKELAQYMDIDYYEDTDGTVGVVTPKGTPLVMGLNHYQLQATKDENGDIHVEWQRSGGAGAIDITENIQNGRLGGWLELRDVIMDEFYQQFDAFAENLIFEVNRQHTQGAGLTTFTDVTSTYDIADEAAVVVEFDGEDNDLRLTALSSNASTNDIGIRFVKAAAFGDPLTVTTTRVGTSDYFHITVTLPINANGNVTATAQDVIDAINETRSADLPQPPPFPPSGPPYNAGDLIQATLEEPYGSAGDGRVDAKNDLNDPVYGPGYDFIRLNHNLEHTLFFGDRITYGYEYARLETELAGDDNDVIFTALDKGAPGENISVAYVDPGAANQPLTIAVSGGDITISLATDAAGVVTTTAEDIIYAIVNDVGGSGARDLVSVERASGQSGAGRVTAMAREYLDRSGSFDLVTYGPDGAATVYQIKVNPTDRREDIIAQIGATSTLGVVGLSAEIVEDTGQHYIRIKADQGYSFAFADDNASALAALGLNTFFEGTGNASIQVNGVLENNLGLIAAGRLDEYGLAQTGDNENALDLADLKDQKFYFRDQYCTISEAYNTLTADVGSTTHAITRNNDFNQVLVDQINNQRDMISAVNLDEEMADMLRFQYMYQAAAKMIAVTDEMLQTLLAIK